MPRSIPMTLISLMLLSIVCTAWADQRKLASSPLLEGFKQSELSDGSIDYTGPSRLRKKLEERKIGLVVMRHGQSESNAEAERLGQTLLVGQSESPLTSLGENQARNAATLMIEDLGGKLWMQRLRQAQVQPPIIFSSSLSRASRTGEILVLKLEQESGIDMDLHLDPRLRETNFGEYEGRPLAEFRECYPDFVDHWRPSNDLGTNYLQRFPEGESRMDVMSRVSSLLEEIADKYPRRTIILISHSECLIALRAALGLAPTESGKIRAETSVFANARPYWILRPTTILTGNR